MLDTMKADTIFGLPDWVQLFDNLMLDSATEDAQPGKPAGE
jgi:hypothetical protein